MAETQPKTRTKIWFGEEADALMAEVKERLAQGSEALLPREIDGSRLISEIVISLELDFDAHIDGIYTDQWSAVSATTRDGSFRSWVECDLVEHGFAATWKLFADRAAAAADSAEQPEQSGA